MSHEKVTVNLVLSESRTVTDLKAYFLDRSVVVESFTDANKASKALKAFQTAAEDVIILPFDSGKKWKISNARRKQHFSCAYHRDREDDLIGLETAVVARLKNLIKVPA